MNKLITNLILCVVLSFSILQADNEPVISEPSKVQLQEKVHDAKKKYDKKYAENFQRNIEKQGIYVDNLIGILYFVLSGYGYPKECEEGHESLDVVTSPPWKGSEGNCIAKDSKDSEQMSLCQSATGELSGDARRSACETSGIFDLAPGQQGPCTFVDAVEHTITTGCFPKSKKPSIRKILSRKLYQMMILPLSLFLSLVCLVQGHHL